MKFKYALQHAGCAEACPPNEAKQPEGSFEAYRLVVGTTIGDVDFVPKSVLARGFETRPFQCQDHALSFLKTRNQARKAYKRISSKVPQWPFKHSVKTTINPADGFATKPSSRTGHFDLHESITAALHHQATYCEDCSSCENE